MLFCIIKLLLHECSGNMKIYSPRKITFSLGIALEKYDISWGEKSSHFPHHHASKCILMAFMQFFKITTNGFYIITKMDSTSIHCLLCVNPNKWIYIITLSFMHNHYKLILHHYTNGFYIIIITLCLLCINPYE